MAPTISRCNWFSTIFFPPTLAPYHLCRTPIFYSTLAQNQVWAYEILLSADGGAVVYCLVLVETEGDWETPIIGAYKQEGNCTVGCRYADLSSKLSSRMTDSTGIMINIAAPSSAPILHQNGDKGRKVPVAWISVLLLLGCSLCRVIVWDVVDLLSVLAKKHSF